MPLSIPKFIKTAFSQFGMKNSIPETTNNITGAAGYNQGFSEINMLPEGAGGIPPDGKDFNGIFYEITSSLQYLQSGVIFPYNQEFATAIGGYPKGARVADLSDTSIIYTSQINNNLSPPPGANWVIGASETIYGSTKYATQSETNAGTSDNLAITPLKFKSAFVASLAANGYQKLPSGLIIQWIQNADSGGSAVTKATLPIAFPNSILLAVPIDSGAGVALKTYGTWDSSASTLSSVVIGWAADPTEYSVLCIGY